MLTVSTSKALETLQLRINNKIIIIIIMMIIIVIIIITIISQNVNIVKMFYEFV